VSTIFDPIVRASLEARVRTLRVDSPRLWGRMTAHQAVCHMSDAFRMAFGEKDVAARRPAFAPMVRFVALRLPMNWPHGIRTLPEVEQGCGGTTPTEFERDRAELLSLMARFSQSTEAERQTTHPIFGGMTTALWGAWGYRHLDHHLRQFGV
jgi:hypothetical protein